MSDFIFHGCNVLKSFAEMDFIVSREWDWRNYLVFIVKNELTCGLDPSVSYDKISVENLLKRKGYKIGLIYCDLLWAEDKLFDTWAYFKSIKIF